MSLHIDIQTLVFWVSFYFNKEQDELILLKLAGCDIQV